MVRWALYILAVCRIVLKESNNAINTNLCLIIAVKQCNPPVYEKYQHIQESKLDPVIFCEHTV